MNTITFKNGTTLTTSAVTSLGNKLVQGTSRMVYDVTFTDTDFTTIKSLAQDTAALSEFTIADENHAFTHYNFTIPVEIKQDLQTNEITLSLAQMSAVEIQLQELQKTIEEMRA